MNQKLSTKTFAILYWNDDYDWVNEEEAAKVVEAKRRGDKGIFIGKEYADIASIQRVISGEKMQGIIRYKNGERQCGDCRRWIPKGYVCGCQGGKF